MVSSQVLSRVAIITTQLRAYLDMNLKVGDAKLNPEHTCPRS